MTIFKFPESIKSRPTYGKLEYREGKSYLFIADADGAEAIIDLANDNKSFALLIHGTQKAGTVSADAIKRMNSEKIKYRYSKAG
jgi:hypothetical protein